MTLRRSKESMERDWPCGVECALRQSPVFFRVRKSSDVQRTVLARKVTWTFTWPEPLLTSYH